jgi:hypothetical protein
MGYYGLDWSGSEQGPVEGSCESGNEPLGSTKCWEVFKTIRTGHTSTPGHSQHNV